MVNLDVLFRAAIGDGDHDPQTSEDYDANHDPGGLDALQNTQLPECGENAADEQGKSQKIHSCPFHSASPVGRLATSTLTATSRPASIKRADASAEYHTSEGCDILELSNAPDDEEVSIARARVGPGVTTRWHRLKGTTERYVILEGRGRVEVGELPPQEVVAGDVVLIPPLCRQRIANTGDTDLIFLAICTPRFVQECYEDLEKP